MKKIYLLFSFSILCILTFALCSVNNFNIVFADTDIIVTGSAMIDVNPDLAIIDVGVYQTDADLSVAVSEMNNKASQIIAYLQNTGISKDDIISKTYNIFQKYDFINGSETFQHQASTIISFKTTNLENISDLLQNILEQGANRIERISFTCSNSEKYYNEAINKALENAKSKASSLVSENLTIKKITEEKNFFNNIYKTNLTTDSLSDFINIGKIQISATVLVEFEQIDNKNNTTV